MSTHLPEQVRHQRPLVHAITNFVTMDWVARGLLAAGARPVMARDLREAALAAGGADALVLNLGTWSPDVQAAMVAAGKVANTRNIPVVLDPVGAGAMATRTAAALDLLQTVQVTAIRGNVGEIAALAGESGLVSGVDSRPVGRTDAAELVRRVALQYGAVVAATGEQDLVSDGVQTGVVTSGHPLMAQIPGTGCLVSALMAAGLAASVGDRNRVEVVADVLLWAGAAGEESARLARGPGSFAVSYLDALAAIDTLPAGRIAPPLDSQLSVYVLVNGTTSVATLQTLLDAGVRAIQFREKGLPLREQMAVASEMRARCHQGGALFIVNDRVDVAMAVAADGVHLGQDDLPVAQARLLLGPQAIIGATCETVAEVRAAAAAGASYIGTGPVYATPTKADAGAPYGPMVVERAAAATRLPVVGIGGIGIGTAAPVIRAGGCGVAVISSVLGAADPASAAQILVREVAKAKEENLR